MYPLVVLQSYRITQLLATDITGVPIPRMFVEYMPIQFRPVLALVITALHRAPKKTKEIAHQTGKPATASFSCILVRVPLLVVGLVLR